MLFRIGHGVLRPRHLLALLEALEIIPAPLRGHGPTQFVCHPVSDVACAPAFAAVRSRAGERPSQLLVLRPRQHLRRPPGSGVLPIDHARWPLLVVALGDLANPIARVARVLGNGGGCLPFC
ncbi:MAG TPA: hypothetical protein VGP82_08285 [Ktedonobacterales bacterium]|nr:hypothetical protein [Ktedonobacterales bacterium]